jgi:hypothetical protein
MSQTLIVQLNDEAYASLQQQAAIAGSSPAEFAKMALERHLSHASHLHGRVCGRSEGARDDFERHFGSVDLGRETGADNVSIDADLARQYADFHDES